MNPAQREDASSINSVIVTYFLSDSHILKRNHPIKEMQQLSTSSETTITIEGLEPEETYNVTISFVTDFGISEPSEVVQSMGILDTMKKTDGCLLDNDLKFKSGVFTNETINTIIGCAEACAKDRNNIGW